jgi:hypothetical protein
MAKDGRLSVSQLRQSLLDLSARQIELRGRLTQYRSENDLTIGAVARQTGVSWQRVKDFIDGTMSISGGRGLTGLCELLECPELGDEVAVLAKRVGDRNLALANQPHEVIIMALDLVEYHRDRADRYNMAEFAAAFNGDAPTVLGALNASQEALLMLAEEQTRERITQLLLVGLDERLAKAKEKLAEPRREAGAKLAELVGPLAERVGSKTRLAKLLNCSRTTLASAVAGEASLEQIERLITEAGKISRMLSPPSEGQPGDTEAAEVMTVPGVPSALAALAGITTDDGTEYVLTEEAFRQIGKVPLVALRDALLSAIKQVRLLLNIASQLADDEAREILQEAAARELRELDVALKLFAFKYPSRLLPLYDNQRELWHGATTDPSSRKAGS